MTTLKAFKRPYTFPDGSKIDLRRVIFIGALDKDINAGIFFLPVYVTGMNKPIEIKLGFSLGKVDETKKTVILKTIAEFVEAWELYLDRKEAAHL